MTHAGVLLASALALVPVLAGCQSTAAIGASCGRASDCVAPLTCTFGRCRSACTQDRDCPVGFSCLLDGTGSGVCQLDSDLRCQGGVGRECATGLVCVADRCARTCTGAADCPSDGVCASVEGNRVCALASVASDGGARDATTADDGGTPDAATLDGSQNDAASLADTGTVLDAATGCVTSGCAGSVVISEVGIDSTDYFVELYNTSVGPAALRDCVLFYIDRPGSRTAAAFFPSTTVVPAHGFLLAASTSVSWTPTPDVALSAPVESIGGAFSLECDAGATVLDLVGWGMGGRHEGSGTAPHVSDIERRASATSTAATLGPGGSEELLGNGWDTDDNAADFVAQTSPNPQSTASPPEP